MLNPGPGSEIPEQGERRDESASFRLRFMALRGPQPTLSWGALIAGAFILIVSVGLSFGTDDEEFQVVSVLVLLPVSLVMGLDIVAIPRRARWGYWLAMLLHVEPRRLRLVRHGRVL